MAMYMLISVYERNIFTELFGTLENAQVRMHEEMIADAGVSKDIFCEEEYDDGDCGFDTYSAYVNDGKNHDNYDWLIVQLGGRNEGC